MRPSKGEMLSRLETLENQQKLNSNRDDGMRKDLNQLESIVEELAKRQGYYLVYKNGYYLEPIMDTEYKGTRGEAPYGN